MSLGLVGIAAGVVVPAISARQITFSEMPEPGILVTEKFKPMPIEIEELDFDYASSAIELLKSNGGKITTEVLEKLNLNNGRLATLIDNVENDEILKMKSNLLVLTVQNIKLQKKINDPKQIVRLLESEAIKISSRIFTGDELKTELGKQEQIHTEIIQENIRKALQEKAELEKRLALQAEMAKKQRQNSTSSQNSVSSDAKKTKEKAEEERLKITKELESVNNQIASLKNTTHWLNLANGIIESVAIGLYAAAFFTFGMTLPFAAIADGISAIIGIAIFGIEIEIARLDGVKSGLETALNYFYMSANTGFFPVSAYNTVEAVKSLKYFKSIKLAQRQFQNFARHIPFIGILFASIDASM